VQILLRYIPFDVILQANKTQNWLPLIDVFRNSRVEINLSLIELKDIFFNSDNNE
jgi:hypothetical protein